MNTDDSLAMSMCLLFVFFVVCCVVDVSWLCVVLVLCIWRDCVRSYVCAV